MIGLGIYLTDFDDPAPHRALAGYYTWGGAVPVDASDFGDAWLLPRDRRSDSERVTGPVSSQAWARIKVGLQTSP